MGGIDSRTPSRIQQLVLSRTAPCTIPLLCLDGMTKVSLMVASSTERNVAAVERADNLDYTTIICEEFTAIRRGA